MVQLAVRPAAFYGQRDPLEEPVYDPKRPDSLRAPDSAPPELVERVAALRARVRGVYCEQLRLKLEAIVAQCLAWGVRIVVFPEYSVPWDLLPFLARSCGDMVVVAGTHTVTKEAVASRVYERLGASAAPKRMQAVCPVLHRGKFLALHAKLNPAVPEQQGMRPGDTWAPVELPDGLPGPMGVLVCLDFLYRESPKYRALVQEALEACRFLAVPSLTPHHTLPEFEGKAWEEARRYKRPVLYCDTAEGGGTSVFVDEGRAEDLRDFPRKAGRLDRGDEGIVVCDIDLGHVRRGDSTSYEAMGAAVVPFAAASLVYRTHPAEDRYAEWLAELEQTLAPDDDDAADAGGALVARSQVLLTDAMSLPGREARKRRLRALLREVARFQTTDEVRPYAREVVLPPEALPLPVVEAAMANAAAEAVHAWGGKWRGLGVDALGEPLREAAKRVRELESAEWTDAARKAIGAVERAVKEPAEPSAVLESVGGAEAKAERVSLPTTFDPATFEDFEGEGWRFLFRRTVAEGRDLWTPKPGQVLNMGFGNGTPDQPYKLVRYGKEYGPLSVDRLVELQRLLAIAQGVGNVAVVFCLSPVSYGMLSPQVLMACREGWRLRSDRDDGTLRLGAMTIRAALEAKGFSPLVDEPMRLADVDAALTSLLPIVDGARATITAFRTRRLAEVSGVFIDTDAHIDDLPPAPILATLDDWLASDVRTALVVGSFGAGKSTALAQWCHALWQRPDAVRPVLVNLATAQPDRDPIGMLLDAASAPDTAATRAAMTLLVQRGRVLPCFDGFDELSSRATDQELPGRLRALLAVAADGGRVVVSAREHYFSHEERLVETSRKALVEALGSAATWRRITILELTPAKVRTFVESTQGADRARDVLSRIEATYDLGDLVKRPLLMAMVLATLDRLDRSKRVATADLYEAYLTRWLEQTRAIDGEVFTDDQKRAFAEELATMLWRTGASSIPWKELDAAVTRHLAAEIPEGTPHGAEWLEMRGGAFFVREGEDRYRFAHRSFLEYFTARALVGALPKDAGAALATRPLTREVVAFVGEILAARGDVAGSEAVRAAQRWVKAGRAREEDTDVLRATAGAAANALRLLAGLAQHVGSDTQWVPEGSDLRGVSMARAELRGARLAKVRLDGAVLSRSDLREALLGGTSLRGAQMVACRLDGASLEASDLRGAVLQEAEGAATVWRGADVRGAVLRASAWRDAAWAGCQGEGAEVTAAAAAVSVKGRARLPAALRARIAEGHRGSVWSVSWSPHGDRLASGGSDGTVRLWDAYSGAMLTISDGHYGDVSSVSWSPQGDRVASGGSDGTVRLWDTATGAMLASLEGHGGGVWSVSWSPQGDRVASGGSDGTVRLWNASSSAMLALIEGHRSWVRSVSWSPRGDRVASGGNDGTVCLWDVPSGAMLVSMNGHDGGVLTVSWCPQGDRLASGGADGVVRLWDLTSGAMLVSVVGRQEREINAVSWSPQGDRLASGGDDGAVRLWDVTSGAMLDSFDEHDGFVMSVSWSPQGEQVASGGDDGAIHLWNVASGATLAFAKANRSAAITAVSWSPHGDRVASGNSDGTVFLWDVADGGVLSSLQGNRELVRSVSWSPQGDCVAVKSDSGSFLWDVDSGEMLASVEGGRRAVDTLAAWSRRGERRVSIADGGAAWLTGNAMRAQAASIVEHNRGNERMVSFPSRGERVVCVSRDGALWLWDASSGTALGAMEGHRGGVNSMSWSPQGGHMASGGSDGMVRLWETISGAPIVSLEGHRGAVMSVSWSSQDDRVASGGEDGTIRIWDTISGAMLAAMEGHPRGVRSVSWSPEGNRVISGGNDGTVCLWDVPFATQSAELPAQSLQPAQCPAWSPDGTRVAARGADGSLRVFAMRRPRLLATLHISGDHTLVSTPSGYVCTGDTGRERYVLAAPNPRTPDSFLYLPFGPLRDFFHRPDKVAAALAGTLPPDASPYADLVAAGWVVDTSWDGGVVRLPATPPPPPAALPPPSAPRAPAAPAAPARTFALGRAIERPDDLAGRDRTLLELRSLLDLGQPTALLGPRRSGKTSLLTVLAQQLRDEGRAVTLTPLEGVALATRDDLAARLDPTLRGRPDAADAFEARFTQERDHVFLVDELARLTALSPLDLGWFRNMSQNTGRFVLAGTHWDWRRVFERSAAGRDGSPLNNFRHVALGPLSAADAVAFLTTHAPADAPVSEAAARWAVEACDGWPYYLQLIDWELEQRSRAGNREAHIDRDAMLRMVKELLPVAAEDAFESRWDELPAVVREFLVSGREVSSLTRDAREVLRRTGLYTGGAGHLSDRLPDAPFFDWIKRNADRLPLRPPEDA